ncbi:MAG: hypothetical protein ACRC35_06400 [Angustibacter sp.]
MDLQGNRVLVFGTAGVQGLGLVEQVVARGAVPVRASTRLERVQQWRSAGEDAVLADLLHPDSVRALVADPSSAARAAALHVPVGLKGPDAAGQVVASVGAMRDAGLPVAVSVGTVVPPPGAPDPFGVGPLTRALVDTGASVLAPTAFLENHAAPWAMARMAAGELCYPRPSDDVVGWVTTRDVTAGLVASLERDLGAVLLTLSGTPLTFKQLAAELAAGTGRELVFRRVTAVEFGDLARPFLGDQVADQIAEAYGSMPDGPNPLMAPDSGPAWHALGMSVTSARSWATTHLKAALDSGTP